MKDPKQLALIMSIVERGSGNKLMKLYTEHQVFTHIRCEGTGTATSEIMDILGLGSSEKDIVLSITPRAAALDLLEQLDDDLRGAVPGRGIAFMVPFGAISNVIAGAINLRAKLDENKEREDMQEQKNSLVLVVVNQGFTDTVMDTARKCGARGGTIIRGRWAGSEELLQLKGVDFQEEKEIIAIVVPKDLRAPLMEAIHEKHGLQTEAGAMVCSMGVEQMVHLG